MVYRMGLGRWMPWLVVVALAVGLQACGGGGGGGGAAAAGTTLSGTAGAGAPIVGTVTVRDSAGTTRTVAIEADGHYSVDVSDLVAPFMVRASGTVGGRSVSLYSGATSADVGGTINVTPFTDLIVANIAQTVAENLFNSGNFSGLTADAITAAQSSLQTRLAPILSALGLSTSLDLLRTSFSTDHTGLDSLLDVCQVTVDPNTLSATILNVINNDTIVDNLTTLTDTTVLDDTTGVSTGLTDLQAISAGFQTMTNLFATSLPAPDNATLLALFDSATFLDNGQNLNAFLSELTTDPEAIGLKFSNITIESIVPDTSATVSFAYLGSGGHDPEYHEFNYIKSGGVWKATGNQRRAEIEIDSFARRQYWTNSTPAVTNDTGLQAYIEDAGGFGIDYAIVKGHGLPSTTGGVNGTSEGALYFNHTSQESFGAAELGTAYNGINTMRITNGHNQIPLNDTQIGTISDGDRYTFELWEDNNTPTNYADDTLLYTYTEPLSKKPYLNTELGDSLFATFTDPTLSALPAAILSFAQNGGSLTVNWSLPTGMRSNELHFFRSDYSGTYFDDTDKDVTSTATSATLVMSAPSYTVWGSGINLFMEDTYGRETVTIVNGQ